MRRLRRSIGISAAVSLLVLAGPVDGAAAAPGDPSASAQGNEAAADEAQQRLRKPPVEPRGNPASPAAMRAGRLNCGDVITRSTTLVADVGPCPGNGIIIGADNIRLNLNGHTIAGTAGVGDGSAAGIRLPFRTGVTITGHPGNSAKTGTVTGFDAGVFVNEGSGNTIENLVITDNISPGGEALLGDGIVLFHSAANRIVNNVVTHNGPFDGIGVLGDGSNDNVIHRNTVERTDSGGRDSFGGGGTGIILNAFLDDTDPPRRGLSIFRNQVTQNHVSRNDNAGISNVSHVEGRIEGNVVQDNGQLGETCFPFLDRNICRPTATPSNGIGVTVGPESEARTRMLISGNTVTGNTGDGIVLGRFGFTVRDNRVIGNVATGNGGSGHSEAVGTPFEDTAGYDLHDFSSDGGRPPRYDCDNNVWLDNIFNTAFPACIYVQHGLRPPAPPPPPRDDGGGPIIIGPIEPVEPIQPVQPIEPVQPVEP